MLSLCLTFQGTVPDYRHEKNLTPMWLRNYSYEAAKNILLVISIDL